MGHLHGKPEDGRTVTQEHVSRLGDVAIVGLLWAEGLRAQRTGLPAL